MYYKPVTRTKLTIDRYAAILGIDPWHFNGGYGDVSHPVSPSGNCSDLWPHWGYQYGDQVSRHDLATAIRTAEDLIQQFVGYPLAPQWVSEEVHRYPAYHRPDMRGVSGLNPDGSAKAVSARWKKVLRTGRRGASVIEAGATVVYTDEDNDDIYETATVTVTTDVTDPREIRVFVAGTEGNPRWEIRHPRSITISGGSATIVLDSWLLIDPDNKAWTPNTSNSFLGIRVDTGDASPFVTTVDVYRVYTDVTSASAKLYWEPNRGVEGVVFSGSCTSCSGTGCPACTYVSQDGCSVVRNHEEGLIAPVPATYSADNERWEQAVYTECREPDTVKIWYQAGEQCEDYLEGWSLDPLTDFWAEAIAMLATAKLEREICACNNAAALAAHWRTDTAVSGQDFSFTANFDLIANPFGTKIGELEAFRRVHAFRVKKFDAGLI
jgi:hypothetical protein